MNSQNQDRYNDLERFLNTTGKSGYVNIQAVIAEMARLIGLAPDEFVSKNRTIVS